MDILKLKKVTSMEKVFPFTEPTGEGMEDVLTGLKGETVSFQIAFFWDGFRKSRATAKVTSPVGDRSGSLAALINSGAAAKRAMTIAMKCVIALPGSFSLNFIESSPIKICNMI